MPNEKSAKRALRRHCAKCKQRRIYRRFADWKQESGPELESWVRRNFNHIALCSCWMCGQRRKWEGPTMQERRTLMALRDEY